MKKGIDISYCQKGLDLNAVKAKGVEYVIIRAGISTRTDTEFKTHTEGAIKAGLPYGFYWYSRAFSTQEAQKEAEACLQAIKPYSPTYPIFYDMEEQDQIDKLNKATRTAIITTFCETIKAAGYTAGVYLNPSWLETYVDKAQIVGKYDIWLAHWTNSPDKPSKYDYGQKMWQWGLDKIGTMDVDGDVCFFDYEQTEKETPCCPNCPCCPADTSSTETSNTETKTETKTKTVEELADEVMAGKWGNDPERTTRLTAEGHDAAAVQAKVNEKYYSQTAKPTFIEGDKVKCKPGVTKYADGTKMDTWVPTATLYVRKVENDGKILLVSTEKTKEVYTGRVNASDMQKI